MDKLKLSLFLMVIITLSCKGFGKHRKQETLRTDTAGTFSAFIPRDSANKMISSYINSIDYPASDTNLVSVSIDAALLIAYMQSDPSITNLKITLGHTLDYINSGGMNQPCGYKNTALTMIISCYDASGHYEYYPEVSVLDYASLCPANCPPGDAASPLFGF